MAVEVLFARTLIRIIFISKMQNYDQKDINNETDRPTDRQTDRQTDTQTATQTHRHTDTQTHRHTDTQRDSSIVILATRLLELRKQ
jgi:hypothetical protein